MNAQKLTKHEWYITLGVGLVGVILNYVLQNWGLFPHVGWLDLLYPVLTALSFAFDGKQLK